MAEFDTPGYARTLDALIPKARTTDGRIRHPWLCK
jgi:hypothetical protein